VGNLEDDIGFAWISLGFYNPHELTLLPKDARRLEDGGKLHEFSDADAIGGDAGVREPSATLFTWGINSLHTGVPPAGNASNVPGLRFTSCTG
jgi:hypothetical protein